MSYPLLRAVALSHHPLLKRSAGARTLLAVLAERSNNAGVGFPVTTNRLCALTGICEREVQRHLTAMTEAALLAGWEGRRGRPKKGQAMTLRVLAEEVTAWCPALCPNRDNLPGWGEKNRGLPPDSDEETEDFQQKNRGLSTEKPRTFSRKCEDVQPNWRPKYLKPMRNSVALQGLFQGLLQVLLHDLFQHVCARPSREHPRPPERKGRILILGCIGRRLWWCRDTWTMRPGHSMPS